MCQWFWLIEYKRFNCWTKWVKMEIHALCCLRIYSCWIQQPEMTVIFWMWICDLFICLSVAMRLALCLHVSGCVCRLCVCHCDWMTLCYKNHWVHTAYQLSCAMATLVICHSLSVNRLAGNALNAVPGSAWPLGLWYLWVRISHETRFTVKTCGKLYRCLMWDANLEGLGNFYLTACGLQVGMKLIHFCT